MVLCRWDKSRCNHVLLSTFYFLSQVVPRDLCHSDLIATLTNPTLDQSTYERGEYYTCYAEITWKPQNDNRMRKYNICTIGQWALPACLSRALGVVLLKKKSACSSGTNFESRNFTELYSGFPKALQNARWCKFWFRKFKNESDSIKEKNWLNFPVVFHTIRRESITTCGLDFSRTGKRRYEGEWEREMKENVFFEKIIITKL